MGFMTDGDSLETVAFVYALSLIPWAFLYIHDFISDKWIPMSRTYFNGLLHLFLVTLPLIIIIRYIHLQKVLQDYKEMLAAISASVFSGYHLLRTVWGLYQLFRFEQWAVDTALIMESASYPCMMRPAVPKSSSSHHSTSSSHSSSPYYRVHDNLQLLRRHAASNKHSSGERLPETSNHNRLSAADIAAVEKDLDKQTSVRSCCTHDNDENTSCDATKCTVLPARIICAIPLWLLRKLHKHVPTWNKQTCKRRHEHAIRKLVRCMKVNNTIIDNEFIGSNAPWTISRKLKLRPKHRTIMFVRWSILYLTHFGKHWMEDCRTIIHDSDTWPLRRANLAAKVWATSALRMEAECRGGTSEQSRETFRGNAASSSFFHPGEWSKVTPDFNSQVFDMEHVLKQFFLSDRGTPHGHPIIDSPEHPLPSHAMYRPIIKEAIESLPARFYEDMEHFSPQHIEWFAAFIWVQSWGGCILDMCKSADSDESVRTGGSQLASFTSVSPSARIALSDTPIRVLQDQLGLNHPPPLQFCAFPIVTRGYGPFLWDNRSVLQVSARIDNWIALTTAHDLEFLCKLDVDLGRGGESFRQAHRPLEQRYGTRPGYDRSTDIIACHSNLQQQSLRYQLGKRDPQHSHLEQGLSFMGCVTESVRSGLAEDLNRSGDVPIASWRPGIPEEVASFAISEQLRDCLNSCYSNNTSLFDSSVQERLLWECQNGVQWSWQNKRLGRRDPFPVPETNEAMMLCLLGFPSLKVTMADDFSFSVKSQPESLYFQIWPILGPQPLGIDITVDLQTSNAAAQIRRHSPGEAPQLQFYWQDWRDAFEGRLIGKSAWQNSHYMRELPIRRTDNKISASIVRMNFGGNGGQKPRTLRRSYLVWSGWRPFRAGMTLFELRHSSLIIVGGRMPSETHITAGNPDQQEENTRTYELANMTALSDASVHLASLLALNTNLFKEEEEHLDPGPGESFPSLPSVPEDVVLSLPAGLTRASPSPARSPRASPPPTQSPPAEHSSLSSVSSDDAPPKDVLAKAQLQDPIAMHRLATWLLKGEKGFKKNFNKALLLMERALVLGNYIKTASLLVKTILDPDKSENGSPVDVERAFAAIEMLWRDIAGRHQMVHIGEKEVWQWEGDAFEESERMETLIRLHLKVVARLPTAGMMRNLAKHLTTWGDTEGNADRATLLYESAVLAAMDAKALMELGSIFQKQNKRFTAHLFLRSLMGGCVNASKPLADLFLKRDGHGLTAEDIYYAYEKAAQLGHIGAQRELVHLIVNGRRADSRDSNNVLDNREHGDVEEEELNAV